MIDAQDGESQRTVVVALAVNLLIAVAKAVAAALALHQLTGSAVPDALASIAVGVLLVVVAFRLGSATGSC
jgi:hypothetical protein